MSIKGQTQDPGQSSLSCEDKAKRITLLEKTAETLEIYVPSQYHVDRPAERINRAMLAAHSYIEFLLGLKRQDDEIFSDMSSDVFSNDQLHHRFCKEIYVALRGVVPSRLIDASKNGFSEHGHYVIMLAAMNFIKLLMHRNVKSSKGIHKDIPKLPQHGHQAHPTPIKSSKLSKAYCDDDHGGAIDMVATRTQSQKNAVQALHDAIPLRYQVQGVLLEARTYFEALDKSRDGICDDREAPQASTTSDAKALRALLPMDYQEMRPTQDENGVTTLLRSARMYIDVSSKAQCATSVSHDAGIKERTNAKSSRKDFVPASTSTSHKPSTRSLSIRAKPRESSQIGSLIASAAALDRKEVELETDTIERSTLVRKLLRIRQTDNVLEYSIRLEKTIAHLGWGQEIWGDLFYNGLQVDIKDSVDEAHVDYRDYHTLRKTALDAEDRVKA